MASAAISQINSGDTAWVLTSAALVLLMTPGLAFFYGGLVRHSNILNTMMMSIISMGVVGVLWTLVGFSLAFGEGNSLIGDFSFVGLEGLDGSPWKTSTIPGLVFAMFQMTFAVIAAAIISGAIVERMRFAAYVTLISLWCVLVYAPLAHWVWGGGWIEEMGALDFAGGTVVHISSAVSAAVAALVLGKRESPDDSAPHNVPFVILGASLLWFGWAGFNGGSALAADTVAAHALATTFIASSSAMVARVAVERAVDSRASTLGAINGVVAGLVTITPAAGFVSPIGSLIMGALGSWACMAACRLAERCHFIDDSLDAFAIHGVGGIVGAILTGVFAIDGGLFYGGGFRLVAVQTLGAFAGVAFSGLATLVILLAMRPVMRLRASSEHEEQGLDIATHGEEAYLGTAGILHTLSKRNLSAADLVKVLEHSASTKRTVSGGALPEEPTKPPVEDPSTPLAASAAVAGEEGRSEAPAVPAQLEVSVTGSTLVEV